MELMPRTLTLSSREGNKVICVVIERSIEVYIQTGFGLLISNRVGQQYNLSIKIPEAEEVECSECYGMLFSLGAHGPFNSKTTRHTKASAFLWNGVAERRLMDLRW